MKLREIIISDAIVADMQAKTRDEALRELITSLAQSGALDAEVVEEIVAAMIKREKSGSTGFGKGVAVPHVKHPAIKKMVGVIGRSVAGLDFTSLDSQPVYSIVVLLSPDSQPQQHLAAMNTIFTSLQEDSFRKFLRQSDSRQMILDLLDEADAGK